MPGQEPGKTYEGRVLGVDRDNFTDLPSGLRRLIEAARAAALNGWAPYSGLQVGAAVLGAGGHVFPGCNVESASYAVTLCAERNAVARAIVEGEKAIRAIAVAGLWRGVALVDTLPPCGLCRQLLSEFDPGLPVAFRRSGRWVVEPLSVLFPQPFVLEAPDAPR